MMTKIFLCPADKKYACSWEGQSEDILDHFNHEHEDLLSFCNFVTINLTVPSENRLLFIDTEIYLLQTKIIQDNLCIFLRYLGPEKIAFKITYDIDLEFDNKKLDKTNIQVKDGCFSTSIECINAHFGDINIINCAILVSGDFKSSSSDDGVFLEEEISLEKEDAFITEISKVSDSSENNYIPTISIECENSNNETSELDTLEVNLNENEDPSSPGSVTPNIEELFTTPELEKSPQEHLLRRHKSVEENKRATWYGDLEVLFEEPESPRESTNLQRSRTFGPEDRKAVSAKRTLSNASLGASGITNLDLELRCTNCECHLAPPIFLCEDFHNVCAHCYRNREYCRVCEKKISADKNIELEQKCTNYVYICRNKRNGCSKRFPYQEILEHEVNCTYCFYICPMPECGFKSPYKYMVTHLNLIHSSVKLFESAAIAVFQKYTEMFLVNQSMGIFYCSMTVLDDRVVWKAKFCGPKERKFFCELKFKGKNFRFPLILKQHDDCFIKEIPISELKEQKVKSKNSILAITR